MKLIGIIITLFLLFIGVAFGALNRQLVEVNYLIGTKELPLAVLLIVTTVCGLLFAFFILGASIIKLKAQNKWLQSKLKRLESKVPNQS